MKHAAVFLALGALLAGCGVSKQVVAEKDAALESCRNELATCESQLEASRSQSSSLQGDLDACSRARARAESDLRGRSRDLEACRRGAGDLEAREAQLRERLQKELDEKTVEIDRLKNMLSVRVMEQVLFDSGSAEILPEGKAVLDQIAPVLAETSEEIRVEGHTDNVPIGPFIKDKFFSNWELSAARASSVVRYFQYGHSVDPERMEAVGLSAFRPVAPNDTASGRQLNRRVEIVLTAPR